MSTPPDPVAVALIVADALDALGIRLDRGYLERTAPLIAVEDLLVRALAEATP